MPPRRTDTTTKPLAKVTDDSGSTMADEPGKKRKPSSTPSSTSQAGSPSSTARKSERRGTGTQQIMSPSDELMGIMGETSQNTYKKLLNFNEKEGTVPEVNKDSMSTADGNKTDAVENATSAPTVLGVALSVTSGQMKNDNINKNDASDRPDGANTKNGNKTDAVINPISVKKPIGMSGNKTNVVENPSDKPVVLNYAKSQGDGGDDVEKEMSSMKSSEAEFKEDLLSDEVKVIDKVSFGDETSEDSGTDEKSVLSLARENMINENNAVGQDIADEESHTDDSSGSL
jgi:hypothetical protein